MGRHLICRVPDLKPGDRKIVELEGRSIGVFNVTGRFYALRNRCPHQGAELCAGKVQGVMLPSPPGEYRHGRDGEILRCPWHGWEFDITTGKSVFDPFKCLVKTYDVEVVETAERAGSAVAATVEGEPRVETFPVDVEGGWVVVTV
jgi:nitrite reductase (NADH) small subunit